MITRYRLLAERLRVELTTQDMTGQWSEAVAVPAGPSPLAFALAALGAWRLVRRLRRR